VLQADAAPGRAAWYTDGNLACPLLLGITMQTHATAVASPNIAFIKYWGNRDEALRLPANGSISMTLGGLEICTTVTFDSNLPADTLVINQQAISGEQLERVQRHLDLLRQMADLSHHAAVRSQGNFPIGAGLAASAAAFAALTLAGCKAAGLELATEALSRLARRGSGSAARSLFGGYVELLAGASDEEAFARQIAPASHWDLVDLIALVQDTHKAVGSTRGHSLASSSPLQDARLADAPRRLEECRTAIRNRDFPRLAAIAEQDSNMMHAVMLSSTPPLIYLAPASLAVMRAVAEWRASGLDVCYTVDAGPNVHCICAPQHAAEVEKRLKAIQGVQALLRATPGGGARLAEE
jgi:diphosphomevalonate decarboxylase